MICDRCGQPGATIHKGSFNLHDECPPAPTMQDRIPDAEWLIARRLREAGIGDDHAERLASYAAVAAFEAFTDHQNYKREREAAVRGLGDTP